MLYYCCIVDMYTFMNLKHYTNLMFRIVDIIHKFVKDKYSKRFPELESLVHTPLEYIRTIEVSILSVAVWLFYVNIKQE